MKSAFFVIFALIVATKGASGAILACPRSGEVDSTVSNEMFMSWWTTQIGSRYQRPDKPNDKLGAGNHDFVNLPSSGWTHFVGHIGGGGGTSALYDPAAQILLLCHQYDTAGEVEVLHSSPPPFEIQHADLSAVRLRDGVGVGSTDLVLNRLYAKDSGWEPNRFGPRLMGEAIGLQPQTIAYFLETQSSTGEYSILRFVTVSGRVVYISSYRGF